MKQILILSGKGGTGKTTVSAALIRLLKAKAVADCDVDAPNLHLIMSSNSKPEVSDFYGGDKAVIDKQKCRACGECRSKCRFDAISFINNKAVVNEYICEGCGLCVCICPQNAVSLIADVAGEKRLYLGESVFATATLKMGRGNSGKLVSEVKQAMIKNSDNFEFAVVDGSPGIGCPVIASINGMDMVLMVVEPSQSGISDLKRLVKTVINFDVGLAVCVNKYDVSIDNTKEIEQYCEMENIPFIGKIPYDSKAIEAVNSGKSVVDIDCDSGKSLRGIFEKLLNLMCSNDEL